jgi:hypothetical protein
MLTAKGCQSLCFHEVINSIASPDGQQLATVSIRDCGGATTNFKGSVSVSSSDENLSGIDLLTFEGKPSEIGLEVHWNSDTELVISVSDLGNVREINPNGRSSSRLKVKYEYRKN